MGNYITGKVDRTTLDNLTKDLVGKWKTLYTQGFLPKATQFNGEGIESDKNRQIFSHQFDSVPKIRALVDMFEGIFDHLRIDNVWLLTKCSSNDGFQTWHRDFALGNKITTTIVVNVGSYTSSH